MPAGPISQWSIKILVVRLGYNLEHSKQIVIEVLDPRPEHRWPSHVPTWSHLVGAGAPATHGAGKLRDVSTSA